MNRKLIIQALGSVALLLGGAALGNMSVRVPPGDKHCTMTNDHEIAQGIMENHVRRGAWLSTITIQDEPAEGGVVHDEFEVCGSY